MKKFGLLAIFMVFLFAATTVYALAEVPVPEPASLLLLGVGLAGLVAVRKKFRK